MIAGFHGKCVLSFQKYCQLFFRSGCTISQQGVRDPVSLHPQQQYKAIETVKGRQI